MAREQIIGEIVIGLFLLLLGMVLQPILKTIWKRINRPSPLNAQTKGQLVTSLTMAEQSLDRLNYLTTHPKDLFLYFIQLLLTALFLGFAAVFLYTFTIFLYTRPVLPVSQVLAIIFFAIAATVCLFGLAEANRLSDKKIDDTKRAVQKTIDDINHKLNPLS
jgi:hypothetical protein